MSMFETGGVTSSLSLPRKVLAVLMSIVLVVGLNPIAKAPEAAYAANMKVANTELTTEGEGDPGNETAVATVTHVNGGETKTFSDLQEAVNWAVAGDTVTQLADVTVSPAAGAANKDRGIYIGKAITFDGNGRKLTVKIPEGVQTGYGVLINGDVTIKNATILRADDGSDTYFNGIYIYNGVNNVTLDNTKVTLPFSKEHSEYRKAVVNASSCSLVVKNGSALTAQYVLYQSGSNSHISFTESTAAAGWAVADVRGQSNTISFDKCTLTSTNYHDDDSSNMYSMFWFSNGLGQYNATTKYGVGVDCKDNSVSVTNSTVSVNAEGTAHQAIAGGWWIYDSADSPTYTASMLNNVVTLGKGNNVTLSERGIFEYKDNVVVVTGGTFNVNPSQGAYMWSVGGNKVGHELTTVADMKSGTYDYVANGCKVNEQGGKFVVTEDTENYKAKIGSTYYATLAAAVAAAKTGDTVTLLNDVAAGASVSVGQEVTIDLNGHNIEAATGDALSNAGTLIVKGSGTVSATTTDKSQGGSAAVANLPGAKATLEGGTYNSQVWYAIKNLGEMTISNGVTVNKAENNTDNSSLIDNGWFGDNDKVSGQTWAATTYGPSETNGKLTISGGNFVGKSGEKSMSVMKNDDYGKLEISAGSFDSTNNQASADAATLLNFGTATVSGGYFKGSYPIANGYYGDDADPCMLTITGGTFESTGDSLTGSGSGNANDPGGKVSIKGGLFKGVFGQAKYMTEIFGGEFTAKPADTLIASGYSAYETGDSDYPYAVGKSIALTAKGYEAVYDGAAHGITVNVTDPASDATVLYGTSEGAVTLEEAPTFTEVGTYTVYYKVTADGYTPVTGSQTVSITKNTLKADYFNNIEQQTYSGKQIKPEVTLASGAPASLKGNYQVIYAENTNAGANAGYAVITGKGNYSGIVTKRFEIKPAELTAAMIDVAGSYDYTGSAIAEAKVLFNGVELKDGVDYVASYENNTKPGTATVEVIGLDGNFTGSASKTFEITRSAEQVKVTAAENVPQVNYSAAASIVPRDAAYTVSGTFGAVVYSIAGEYTGPVSINASTGDLTVAAGTEAGEYEVPVSVLAMEGDDSSVGTATVKVKVVEAPSALEVAATGSTFRTLTYSKAAQDVAAVGADYAVNGASGGTLIYAKTLGPDSISVDEETGKITASAGLPAGSYYVGVLAYDQGVEGKYQAGMGQVNFFVQVKKAASDMTVTAASPSVKYGTKAQTIAASKAVTVKGNSGAVTYSATTSSSLTMDATGKITVPAKTVVGSYTLDVTVTDPGDANHTGTSVTVPVTVKVAKAANPLALKNASVPLKYNKSKAQTIALTKYLKTAGQGTVTYKVSKQVNKSNKAVKYFSVNNKGVVSMAKKTPKGTYKVTMSATAQGNANYDKTAKAQTAVITVTVK